MQSKYKTALPVIALFGLGFVFSATQAAWSQELQDPGFEIAGAANASALTDDGGRGKWSSFPGNGLPFAVTNKAANTGKYSAMIVSNPSANLYQVVPIDHPNEVTGHTVSYSFYVKHGEGGPSDAINYGVEVRTQDNIVVAGKGDVVAATAAGNWVKISGSFVVDRNAVSAEKTPSGITVFFNQPAGTWYIDDVKLSITP